MQLLLRLSHALQCIFNTCMLYLTNATIKANYTISSPSSAPLDFRGKRWLKYVYMFMCARLHLCMHEQQCGRISESRSASIARAGASCWSAEQ